MNSKTTEAIAELELRIDELEIAIQDARDLHRREGPYCATCVGPVPAINREGTQTVIRAKIPYPCPTEEILREAYDD